MKTYEVGCSSKCSVDLDDETKPWVAFGLTILGF